MNKKFFALLSAVLGMITVSWGQTWTGAASTNWSTPGNWNTNAVPLATGNVVIPNTPNKPALAANVTVNNFTMQAGSAINFNGFTLSATGSTDIANAQLNNSNAGSDIVLNLGSGGGSAANYIGGSTFTDHVTINLAGTGATYEGYSAGNIYTGNANFVASGSGRLYTSYNVKSTFNGHLNISRTATGITDVFNNGFNYISGNFSYTNNAGGDTFINSGNVASGTVGGTVTVTVTGPGNAQFQMKRIKNQTSGGTVSVQNSGVIAILNDTMLLTSFNVSGFTGAGTDEISGNVIIGNVTIAEGASNTGGVYTGGNILTGNTTLSTNFTATWYEGYNSGNVYNGNTTFNLNGGGRFYSSYNQKCSFGGNLSVNRTTAGITDLFNNGFNYITGNFSYSNLAGGDNYINSGSVSSGAINGTVNINVAGAGNPSFQMRKIKNLTPGGSVSVQNPGFVSILNDTLALSSLQVTGFTGSGSDEMSNNLITGNVTFAEAANNIGGVYVGNNTFNGTTTLQTNFSTTWYEGYSAGNTYNGNASFTLAGAGTFFSSYNQKSSFAGNLTVTRTAAGVTDLFNAGFGALNGNFSYVNNAGGNSYINGNNVQSGTITGTVNIAIAGTGNPTVYLFRLKNLATGGSISIQNSGYTLLRNDTLNVSSLSVVGFTGSNGDELSGCVITGDVVFADAASNIGGVYVGTNTITGTASLSNNSAATWYECYGASNMYMGNASFNRNGSGALNLAYSDTLYAHANVMLNAAASITVNSAIEFTGANNSSLEQLGTQPIVFPGLVMRKTGGGTLTFNDSVTVTSSVAFLGGNILSSPGKELIFASGSSHTGGSTGSHVIGPVIKVGNQAFVFPVGSPLSLNRVAISAPVGAASRFSARYTNQNPGSDGYNTALKAGSFGAAAISQAGYWDVQRLTGVTNVTLTLGFGSNPYEQYANLANLKVAHWNGVQWDDHGNGGITGTAADGTIVNATPITSFSPFAIAGVTSTFHYVYSNPGPGPDGTPVKFTGLGGYPPYQTRQLPAGTYSADSIYLVPNGTAASFKLRDAYNVEKNDTSITVAAAPSTYIAANGNGNINFTGWRHFVYVKNGSNQIIGAVRDNNLTLGNTNMRAYFSTANVASAPNGNLYLKRSFRITSQFAPAGLKRVRFYISKTEFNNLVAADGLSFPNGINSVTITRYTGPQEDSLFNPMPGGNSTIIPNNEITIADLGTMYSLDVDVPGFSTFYIGGNQAKVSLCAGATIAIPSNVNGSTYQWQVNTGSGFTNLSNGGVYSGVTSKTLTLTNVPSSYYGYQYRAFINGATYSQVYTASFTATWQGTANNVWENPANWSCGILPDANTDVLINSGKANYPQLGTNSSVRTVKIATGATATIKTGFTLTITK